MDADDVDADARARDDDGRARRGVSAASDARAAMDRARRMHGRVVCGRRATE